MLDRAILLCGGRGTRMDPSTQVHNKHLLPVYSEQGSVPMIIYPLNTLIRSGCKKILIVSSQEHAGDFVDFLGDGKKLGVEFTYKIQDHNDPARPVGIASALNLAKDYVGSEKFAVHLGDNFYEDDFTYDFQNFEKNNDSHAHVFLKDVYDPQRFGVAVVNNGKIVDIEEKPKAPKSKSAVTGLYLYTPHVFDIIKTLKPSDRGELEVSDINLWYAKNDTMTFTNVKGYWRDMGTPKSMRETIDHINKVNFKHNFSKDLK